MSALKVHFLSELSQAKLEAMEKGEMTDFSFLVGPEGAEPQLMHCFKSDLILASDYFKGLFRSPLTEPPPVRVQCVQPHIFKLILRFAATSTMTEIDCFEDALALGLAADEYLLVHLKEFCISEMKKYITEENVWLILNNNGHIPLIQSACSRILCTRTKECIEHQTFMEASAKSVIFLLQLDELNVESEKELVDACLKLARYKVEKDDPEEGDLMDEVVPYLRLLSLDAKEITSELLQHLSQPQEIYLIRRLCHSALVAELTIPANLNPNSNPRRLSELWYHVFKIIPDNFIQSHGLIVSQNTTACTRTKQGDSISVCLTSKHYFVSICGIEMLTPVFCVCRTREDKRQAVSIDCTVEILLGDSQGHAIFSQRCQLLNRKYNSWFYIPFAEDVVIPKGFPFEIKVVQNLGGAQELGIDRVHHRKFSYYEMSKIDSNFNESGCVPFSKITRSTVIDNSNDEKSDCLIIKSVHYSMSRIRL